MGQRRIVMCAELRHQVGVVLRRNLARSARDGLGRQHVGVGEVFEVAVDGAHTDAEDLGGMRLPGPSLDRLDHMTTEIEGIRPHHDHLQRPLSSVCQIMRLRAWYVESCRVGERRPGT